MKRYRSLELLSLLKKHEYLKISNSSEWGRAKNPYHKIITEKNIKTTLN